MTEPYDKASAGQPITALRWNNLQTQIRDEIEDLKATKLNVAGGAVTGALVVNRAAEVHKDPLHLRGSGNAGLRIETGTAAADVAALRFQHGEQSTGWIGTWTNGRMSFSGAMHLVAGRLGLGVDAPADALHLLQPNGNLGVRLQNGAGPADWNTVRFWHGNAERAFLGTHGATGRFTVNNIVNVVGPRVGVGVGTESAVANTLDVRGDLGVSRSGWHGGLVVNTQHTGWSNAVRDRAEISVDPNNKTLMIVGSVSAAEDDPNNFKWPGMGRRVSLWDRLEVNGHVFTHTLVVGPYNVHLRPTQAIHTTGIAVDNGIIQRGGNPLVGTADLGLYSQIASSAIRIVTTNGPVTFRSDGGIGNLANADILPTGDLKVRRWLLGGGLGVGVDVPAETVHLKGANTVALRIETGATAGDYAVVRFLHGNAQRAAVYTNTGGLTIDSAGPVTVNAGLQVKGGALSPALGNTANAGIQFPTAGTGDEAFIRYHADGNDLTTFRLGVAGDPSDSLRLYQAGDDRLIIHNGQVTIGNGSAPYVLESRALNVAGELKSFGGGSGLRMSDRQAPDTITRDWVLFPHGNQLNFWQGETGNVAWLTKDTLSVPRLGVRDRVAIDNGVIQRGGGWITNTADLGLYSQVANNWVRFVTNNGQFVYYSDSGAGTKPIATLYPNGHLSIGQSINPINFTTSWQGTTDTANNVSEISNDTAGYKTLMIIGNKSSGLGRRVSVWDRFEVNGQAFVNGAVVLASDRALKSDIEPLQGALARALELRPVSFTWTKSGARDIGLIAQEVEPVLPELVTVNEAAELGKAPVQVKGLQYSGIAVLALAAVQELSREVAGLRRELAELRERNA